MSNMTFEQLHAMYTEQLAAHRLDPVQTKGPVMAWYLRRGDSRMMSVLLVFTPEGIVVTGDFCPNERGAISTYGYGLKWFAGQLAPDYLAEKFLPRAHHEDDAEEWFRDELEQVKAEIEEHGHVGYTYNRDYMRLVGRQADIEVILRDGDFSEPAIACAWGGRAVDCEDWPGHTHGRGDKALLLAIQQRFAVLFREKYEGFAADGNPIERTA